MWEAIIWTIFAALLAFGGVGMGLNPPAYMCSRVCFLLAALVLLTRLSWWIAVENHLGSKFLIYVLMFGIFGAVSITLTYGLQWVSDREHQFKETNKPKDEQPPILQPTFREKVDNISFQLGERGFGVRYKFDKLKNTKVSPFIIGDYRPITLYVEDNKLYADVKIYGGPGEPIIEIVHNEFIVRSHGCDKNYNRDALEIVNEKYKPIFQLIYKTKSHIVVKGIFPYHGGIILAGEGEAQLISTSFLQKKPNLLNDFALKRIFKYPSVKYLGQLDDIFKLHE